MSQNQHKANDHEGMMNSVKALENSKVLGVNGGEYQQSTQDYRRNRSMVKLIFDTCEHLVQPQEEQTVKARIKRTHDFRRAYLEGRISTYVTKVLSERMVR